jgi:hypothetical protein
VVLELRAARPEDEERGDDHGADRQENQDQLPPCVLVFYRDRRRRPQPFARS